MADKVTINAETEGESRNQKIEVEFVRKGGMVVLNLPEGCRSAIIDSKSLKKVSDFFN